MYAIVTESYGKYGRLVPCGNSGMQKLHNKTVRGWMKETECLRKNTSGNVYIIAEFTQKMCEMGPKQLAEYVIRNHIVRLK